MKPHPRTVAQADPIPNLTKHWGDVTQNAKRHLENAVAALREMDNIADSLAEHGMTVTVDLGVIGNAAAGARRDLEREGPGLHEDGQEVHVTVFKQTRQPVTLTARWWMKPICWITRRPTTRTVYR